MRTKLIFTILLVFFCAYANAKTNEFYIFPKPKDKCVNDFAGLINPEDTKKIKLLCEEITQDELAVIVVVTLDSIPKVKKEYENPVIFGTDLFNTWGIGRKGIDDGVLIFISKNDRKTAIVTGYLTEYFLPDSEAGRILDKYMIPEFTNGEFGTGIIAGIIEARKVMEQNRKLMYPENLRSMNNNLSKNNIVRINSTQHAVSQRTARTSRLVNLGVFGNLY